jgi:hypothetical protein
MAKVYVLEWVILEVVEHGGEITLTRIRQQYDDTLAFVLGATGHLSSSKGGSTRRDTHEQSLLLCQLTTGKDGVIILHIEHLIDDVSIISVRDEACSNALYLVGTALSAVEDRR